MPSAQARHIPHDFAFTIVFGIAVQHNCQLKQPDPPSALYGVVPHFWGTPPIVIRSFLWMPQRSTFIDKEDYPNLTPWMTCEWICT
jgi:hypothetical protein